jgi:hypothetical protein
MSEKIERLLEHLIIINEEIAKSLSTISIDISMLNDSLDWTKEYSFAKDAKDANNEIINTLREIPDALSEIRDQLNWTENYSFAQQIDKSNSEILGNLEKVSSGILELNNEFDMGNQFSFVNKLDEHLDSNKLRSHSYMISNGLEKLTEQLEKVETRIRSVELNTL